MWDRQRPLRQTDSRPKSLINRTKYSKSENFLQAT
jgi:hypothetical protein